MDENIDKTVSLINSSKRILIFTGAGMSTESGIPDFRSPGGLWDRYDPNDFYLDRILSDDKALENYWEMSTESYYVMKKAEPNAGHLALKKLEDAGKLFALVTQNIDSMHHRAGNSPEKIIEIHGTAFSVSCLKCGKIYDRDEIEERRASGDPIPCCDDCNGVLKPATISFGQSMPEKELSLSFKYAEECDLCIVLGSSLVVYPAASIPEHAVNSGTKLIIINRDETPLDSTADLVIHESISETLVSVMRMIDTS